VNLSEIGQASTSSNSAYSNSSISPTVTYQNLLRSRTVADRAAQLLNEKVAAIGQPNVKLLDQTSLIRLEVAGVSPEQARDRANAFLTAFQIEVDQLRNDEISGRDTSSSGQIRQYQEIADAIRMKISALQIESGLTSADQYKGIVSTIEALKTKVAETEASVLQHDKSVESLAAMLRLSPRTAAIALKLHADVEYKALADTTSKEASAVAELSRHFGPRHPKVEDSLNRYQGAKAKMLERAVAVTGLSARDLKGEIDMSSDGERATLLARLVTLVVERDGLAAQLTAQKAELAKGAQRVVGLVEAASRLDSLNRDYKVAEAVFASMLARINASKIDIYASYPMFQVAEPATLPWAPSSPNKLIALGAGGASSLFLLVSLALTWTRRPLIEKLIRHPEATYEPKAA
jgi:uncharacterized protein involved in exopolysaccharide biosynthesis